MPLTRCAAEVQRTGAAPSVHAAQAPACSAAGRRS